MRRVVIVLAVLLCCVQAIAQNEPVTVAFIYPQNPENVSPEQYFYGGAGEAGRLGARMAAAETGWQAQQVGQDFRVMMANAPNAASASRAAERLIAAENVQVLIGGFEASQAAELSRLAAEHNVLFINVGSTGRTDLVTSHTLSLMPSDVAFLTAIRRSESFEPLAPWLVLSQDHAQSADKVSLAQEVLLPDSEAEFIETSTVAPVFRPAIDWLEANPTAHVLLLLDWRHQLEFMSQLEASSARPDAIWVLPDSVTGTREYLGILRNSAPESIAAILTQWDATVDGGLDLNARFEASYGMPMDAPAWASYQAVQLAFRALQEAPEQHGTALRNYLVGIDGELELGKSGNPDLDAHSGELLQDIYVLNLVPLEPGLSILQRQRQRVQVTETIEHQ